MIALGERLAGELRAGDVVALVGGLGAGKTHFTKGIVRGLGSAAEVTSPTFALVHEYSGGRLPVVHLDFYRLGSEAELAGLGWDELLDHGGVVVAEWADCFPAMLPGDALWVRIDLLPCGGRRVGWRRGSAEGAADGIEEAADGALGA